MMASRDTSHIPVPDLTLPQARAELMRLALEIGAHDNAYYQQERA
jgi:hypothetical protein